MNNQPENNQKDRIPIHSDCPKVLGDPFKEFQLPPGCKDPSLDFVPITTVEQAEENLKDLHRSFRITGANLQQRIG